MHLREQRSDWHTVVELSEIQKGIESLQSLSGRFHIIENEKYTIVDRLLQRKPDVHEGFSWYLKMRWEESGIWEHGELGENEKSCTGKSELSREIVALIF